MLPDSLLGGLTLSVVNMVVVFLMLGALCVTIQVIHKVVSVLRLDSDIVAHPVGSTPSLGGVRAKPELAAAGVSEADSSVAGAGPEYGLSDMKAKRAGAVVAHAGPPVFLRGIKDSGAWGKSGRPKSGRV